VPDNNRPVVVVGRVVDGQSAGFHWANVRVIEAGASVGTDESGRYQIVLPPRFRSRSIPVNVRAIGFKPQNRTVWLAGDTVRVDFAITADMMQRGCTMGEVIVRVGDKR
jgi:hypothetical protein